MLEEEQDYEMRLKEVNKKIKRRGGTILKSNEKLKKENNISM